MWRQRRGDTASHDDAHAVRWTALRLWTATAAAAGVALAVSCQLTVWFGVRHGVRCTRHVERSAVEWREVKWSEVEWSVKSSRPGPVLWSGRPGGE